MEEEEYNNIISDLRCSTFHMNDEQAKPVIDKFIKNHPELLDFHDREWYYKNC
jgi:hypothetical protein